MQVCLAQLLFENTHGTSDTCKYASYSRILMGQLYPVCYSQTGMFDILVVPYLRERGLSTEYRPTPYFGLNFPANFPVPGRSSTLLMCMPNWPTYTSKNGIGSLIARSTIPVCHHSTIPLFHSTIPRSIESRLPRIFK